MQRDRRVTDATCHLARVRARSYLLSAADKVEEALNAALAAAPTSV